MIQIYDHYSRQLPTESQVFSADTLNGVFSTLALSTLVDGMFFDIAYLFDEFGSTDIIRLSVMSSAPLTATFWLFGSGLLGLIGVARKKTA